ncbi:hypothetical protein [Aurantiacibacter xanthus]|uniref:hypothetical protein n=1 Tax=Aurantiacibacter xanthus TaxID=1784712 RepID=UPI0011C2273C|nr:hypothetical protein [Aurantiacibacter xanthus]
MKRFSREICTTAIIIDNCLGFRGFMRLTFKRNLFIVIALAPAILLSSCGLLSASEPTDEELDQAVRQYFQSIAGDGVVRNPLSNLHMNLEEVRKLGCEPANEGPGFFCTYSTRMTAGVSSNETSSDGIAHAEAADALVRTLTGGNSGMTDTATHRFVNTFGGWEMVAE